MLEPADPGRDGSGNSFSQNSESSNLSSTVSFAIRLPEDEGDPPIPRGVLGSMEPSPYHNWKRVWELPVALLLAPPALMMTLPLILLVRLTSKGPGIYKQTRSGLNGKTFTMYKLRSMRIDAEADGLPKWAAGDKDKRITKVGYWLRKLHLDELPQIINVIRGDMSFCEIGRAHV
mgnify:FL=1